MAILPVMHDEHGILHVTGNKILLCVRKTIATTPKNSDGVLLSFRPMQMTDNWPKRLATFLHALHLLCAWKICCKKDGARMIPGTYKGRVVYTHAHADGTITRQDVPSHIAVEQINKRLFQKS